MNLIVSLYSKIYGGIARRYRWFVVHPKARQLFQKQEILDSFESIEYIIKHRCSVSRYGDGEIGLLFGKGIGFQSVDNDLGERLKQVLLATDVPNHVVGIPYFLKNVDGAVEGTRIFWGEFACKYGKLLQSYLTEHRTYIDTQISRFYIEYHDRARSTRQLHLLKKIWDGRDVVIVEGAQSRTGVGNDLYDNAKSIQRILGYPTNGFSHYDEMLKAIASHISPQDGKLILLSYGPTATVLAYDLAKQGYQAVDIGHLDIEYEWYLNADTNKGAVNGKYTNEVAEGNLIEDCLDEQYISQIICDISKTE